jgi:hypothetical protein
MRRRRFQAKTRAMKWLEMRSKPFRRALADGEAALRNALRR